MNKGITSGEGMKKEDLKNNVRIVNEQKKNHIFQVESQEKPDYLADLKKKANKTVESLTNKSMDKERSPEKKAKEKPKSRNGSDQNIKQKSDGNRSTLLQRNAEFYEQRLESERNKNIIKNAIFDKEKSPKSPMHDKITRPTADTSYAVSTVENKPKFKQVKHIFSLLLYFLTFLSFSFYEFNV
jgi:hypothetical protein